MMRNGSVRKGASPRRKAFFVFVVTTLVFTAVLGGVGFAVWTYPDRITGTASGTIELTVPRGAAARHVANLLADEGWR